MRPSSFTALGVVEELQLSDFSPVFGHRDSLVTYTDGIPDALNSRDEENGMTRLIEAVASLGASDAKLQLDRLSKEVEDFIGDTPPFDDVTFCILARQEG